MSRAVSLSGHAARPAAKGFWATLQKFDALRRQRTHLAMLDDAALHDIGLTREDAQTEARRPVWDAPQHWAK